MNPIKERKPIKYLAVENISFDHLACTNSRFFHNRHLSIILNDKPLNTASLQKEIIYHVAEARLILILKGCVEVNLNLEDQYIEQGHVLLLPADSIMELKECSDDLEVIAFIIREKFLIDENDLSHLGLDTAHSFSQRCCAPHCTSYGGQYSVYL